jgi:hypothetical protein
MESEVELDRSLDAMMGGQVIQPGAGAEESARSGLRDATAERIPADPEPSSYVYALGTVEPRYPSLGIEKEVAQVAGRGEPGDQTDRQVLRTVLADPANRYLARRVCWLLVIDGLESYILVPSDPTDLDLLIRAYREYPSSDEVDVVIGTRGPIAPPEACSGVTVPIVVFEQLYSFTRTSLVDAIPRPKSLPKARDAQFRETAGEVWPTTPGRRTSIAR